MYSEHIIYAKKLIMIINYTKSPISNIRLVADTSDSISVDDLMIYTVIVLIVFHNDLFHFDFSKKFS